MASTFKKNTPKSVGSIYFNLRESDRKRLGSKLEQCVNWLTENDVFLAISVKEEDSNDYKKLVGFFNKYKRDDAKDPDVVLRPALAKTGSSFKKRQDDEEDDAPVFKKKKPRFAEDEEEEEERPVTKKKVVVEEDEDEEEEKPVSKKRKRDDDIPF